MYVKGGAEVEDSITYSGFGVPALGAAAVSSYWL